MPANESITADEYVEPVVQPDVDEDDERARRRRRGALAALAAAAVILGLIVWWILTYTVPVPDVVGVDRGDALIRLTAADLRVGEVSSVFAPGYVSGEIAEQGPAAGQRALRGSRVDLAVASPVEGSGSEGAVSAADSGEVDIYGGTEWGAWERRDTSQPKPRTYSTDYPGDVVPAVQALTEKKARKLLRDAGYQVKVKRGPTSSGPGPGKVFFQDPSPFSPEKRGSKVEIWVSTGGPDTGRTCPVPRESN